MEDFSSATDKLQELKEEMQDAATIVGQEVREEVEEVATNTDAVKPAIPPTAKRRRLARWDIQREQAAQTLIAAFVKTRLMSCKRHSSRKSRGSKATAQLLGAVLQAALLRESKV